MHFSLKSVYDLVCMRANQAILSSMCSHRNIFRLSSYIHFSPISSIYTPLKGPFSNYVTLKIFFFSTSPTRMQRFVTNSRNERFVTNLCSYSTRYVTFWSCYPISYIILAEINFREISSY